MRRALVICATVSVALFGLAALATVVDFPGESRLKQAIGYDDGSIKQCFKIAGEGARGEWRDETSLATTRDEPRAVSIGNGIYIVGGIRVSPPPLGTRSLAEFDRYDIRARRYEALSPLPIGVDHTGMATVGGAVYVIGGTVAKGERVTATNRAFRYDPGARRWTELPPMRFRRGAFGTVVVGPRIFVIGGRANRIYDGSPSVGAVESFDTRTQTWSQHASLPVARDHLGAAEYGGKIYVYAGRDESGEAVALFDRYDPATDRWTPLPDGPQETSGIMLMSAGSYLYTAGGEVPATSEILGDTWRYVPAAERWERLAPLPVPRHGYASVIVRDRAYVIGGSVCPGYAPTRTVISSRLPAA